MANDSKTSADTPGRDLVGCIGINFNQPHIVVELPRSVSMIARAMAILPIEVRQTDFPNRAIEQRALGGRLRILDGSALW